MDGQNEIATLYCFLKALWEKKLKTMMDLVSSQKNDGFGLLSGFLKV
jgi:hypothetical protein